MTLYRFYRIVGKGIDDSKEYIGSTTQQLHKRLYEHRTNYTTKGKCSSKFVFELYGIDNCSIILIHELECESKQHALKEERRIFEERKERIVNKNRPSTLPEEEKADRKILYEKNKDKIKEQTKKWEENNVERRKEARKKYLEANKERIREQKARYEARKKLTLDGESQHSSGSPSLSGSLL